MKNKLEIILFIIIILLEIFLLSYARKAYEKLGDIDNKLSQWEIYEAQE